MTNNEAICILAIVVETAKGRCFVTDEAISDAYAMAISALQAQDSPKPTAESVQNVQNEDLISRKAAIDALGERPMVWTDDDQYALGERNQYDIDRLAIETLPSAQPEPLVKESRTLVKDLVKDTISRQAAIDAVEHITSSMSVCVNTDECHGMKRMQRQAVIELANLPSAEPEPCDDAVSRKAAIDAALSAFSRGLLASPDIRKLPSVQPEPHWIPVSERLPEAEVLCCDIRGEMIIGYPYQDDESNTGYSAVSDDVYMIDCIAWMPLPEPYRAERRTDD